jgi:hypothetical protein
MRNGVGAMKRWFALVLLLALLVPSSALSTGTMVIPNNIFSQPQTFSSALLDQNWQAVAAYVNARENTLGLLSARPVAGVAGRLYTATDVNGGTLFFDNGSSWTQIAPGVSSTVAQQLTGLGLANNGTATATFTIAVGAATSDDAVIANRLLMGLTTGLTKSLASWALGTGVGCLDAGSVATFTWYHVFLIERLDTGVVDAVCSTSATAPTMPTNYTKKRNIGAVRTDWSGTGSIYFFSQVGDRFVWATKTTTLDVNTATSGVVAVTATLSTPNGVQTLALVNLLAGSAAATQTCYLSELAATDEAASLTAAPLGSAGVTGASAGLNQAQVMTDTASSIRYRCAANNPIAIVTTGYIHRRGQQ